MKKLIVIGLVIVAVVIAAVAMGGSVVKEEIAVDAEVTVQETQRVEGLIVSVDDGFFVMQDKDLGEIQVNYDSTSVFEGVIPADLAFGQYVFVVFDGKMTRSLPPQIFGQQIGMYPVSGNVLEIGEGSVTLSQENGEVVVFLPEGAPEMNVGDAVTAYTTGAMTMSIPPQTTAMAIEVTAVAE